MSRPIEDLGAVVVHYRSEDTVRATVADLAAVLPPERIVLVDNSGTLDPDGFPARVEVPAANGGYGAGVNHGVRLLPPEVRTVLVVTHEVRIAPADVAALLDTLAATGPGQVGPVLVDGARSDGALWSAGGCYTRWLAYPDHRRDLDDPRPVGWIDGACFVIGRALFEAVGGVPEHFFAYSEDIAFSRLVLPAGGAVALCPDARVTQSAQGPAIRVAVRNRWLLLRGYFPARVAAVGIAQLHLKAGVLACVPTAFHRARAAEYRAGIAEARAIQGRRTADVAVASP